MVYAKVLGDAFLTVFNTGLIAIPLLFVVVVTFSAMAQLLAGAGSSETLTSRSLNRSVLGTTLALGLGAIVGAVLSVGNVPFLSDLVIDNIGSLQKAGALVVLILLIYVIFPAISERISRHRTFQNIIEALLLTLIGLWIFLLNVFEFDHLAYDVVTMPLFFAIDDPRTSHSPLTAIVFMLGYLVGICILILLLHYFAIGRIRPGSLRQAVLIISASLLFAVAAIAIIDPDTLMDILQPFDHGNGHG